MEPVKKEASIAPAMEPPKKEASNPPAIEPPKKEADLSIVDTGNLASSLSHDETLEITRSSLERMFSYDRLLSDLPSNSVLEEILARLLVERGQAITLSIFRDEEPVLKVIVKPTATVRELKKAIRRHFELYQKRIGSTVKISWRYVWKTYDLNYDGIILDNDNSRIDEYGVVNKVRLTFKKKKGTKNTTA